MERPGMNFHVLLDLEFDETLRTTQRRMRLDRSSTIYSYCVLVCFYFCCFNFIISSSLCMQHKISTNRLLMFQLLTVREKINHISLLRFISK